MRCMILTGMPLETIVRMDILTFNALLPLANRVVYRDKIEQLNMGFVAVNAGMSGKRDAVDAVSKGWMKDIGASPEERIKKGGARNAADFMRDFKIGKGGTL